MPSSPQLDAAAATHWLATTGGAPAPIGEHVPTVPVSVHDMHVSSVHARLQHTPCTQKPEAQSDPIPDGHAPPIGILPQLMFTHVFPDVHWLVIMQSRRHAVPPGLHVKGAHVSIVGGLHMPMPSHDRADDSVKFMQVWLPQAVPAAW